MSEERLDPRNQTEPSDEEQTDLHARLSDLMMAPRYNPNQPEYDEEENTGHVNRESRVRHSSRKVIEEGGRPHRGSHRSSHFIDEEPRYSARVTVGATSPSTRSASLGTPSRLPEGEGYIPQVPRSSLQMPNKRISLRTSDRRISGQRADGYAPLEQEEDQTAVAPSTMLPKLGESERRVLTIVENGDIEALEDFHHANPHFDMNFTNYQGMSPLHIAVQNSRKDMIEILLREYGVDVGDCALHAAKDKQFAILLMILEYLRSISPELEYAACVNSPTFPTGTTPLLVASQCGHYEIIGMLIERGHSIQHPHSPKCMCAEVCRPQLLEEAHSLSASLRRVDLYRAITNPAYLCHSSQDLTLTAFLLCTELRQWAYVSAEFQEVYLELAGNMRKFAADLIACCSTTEEVRMILCRKVGCHSPASIAFPRLVLAIDHNQKEFVAHPNAQKVLQATWHGDWFEWGTQSDFKKMLIVFPRIVMLPVIAIMCIAMPKHAWVKHWQLPVNRMLNHAASYILFLSLVFAECIISKKEQKRVPPNSGVEIALVVFVLSYMWGSFRICMLQGPRRHFTMMSNWYDAFWQLLYLCTFVCWLQAYLDTEDTDLDRKYWHYLDPLLIAEGTFSGASIMVFCRLLLLCQHNYYLGPLQVSMGKMVKDIARFLVIYLIIMLAFTAGLCHLYEYYDGMVQKDADGNSMSQLSSFVSLGKTLKTLFWALFCMSPLESADVVIENLPGEVEGTSILNHHEFTEAVGYIAFAMFEVLLVIILLNMLVATICNTFQKVTDNVAVEWTFGRTMNYLMYMSQTTLPPPFNLLPTAAGIGTMLDWCRLMAKPAPRKRAHFSLMHCCYMEEDEDEEYEKSFPLLMAELAQRFFQNQEEGSENGNQTRRESAEMIAQRRQSIKRDLAII